MDLFAATALVVLVLDPLGNIPNFTAALACVPEARRRRVVIRELCFALGLMLAFLFGGRYLFDYLGIQSEALTVAGGIMLFLIAISMLFPPPERPHRGGSPASSLSLCLWPHRSWRGRRHWRRWPSWRQRRG